MAAGIQFSAGESRRRWAFAALAVAALYWTQLFYQLQFEWSANAQYGYGWFVPVLAGTIFWQRWIKRPTPAPPASGVRAFSIVVVLCLAALLPLRLIHEANAGWRSAQWLHAAILLAISLLLLWRLGGKVWLKQFSFPVGFLLLAVPWPNRIENEIIQGLMRLVAMITMELVGLFNVIAIQHGNLLEIRSGIVSVDAACSGVRSLQTSFVISFLAGELYRLRFTRRLVLVLAGVLIALLTNVGRTSFLTWSAATQGTARMESFHDSAGEISVGLLLAGVWILARAFSGGSLPPHKMVSRSAFAFPFSAAWIIAPLAWIFCIEGANVLWFRAGDNRDRPNQEWSINWPTGATGYREIPLPRLAFEMLRYDTAVNSAWQDEAGHQWNVIALRWGPENRNSFIGRGHTPDLCMTSAGWRLASEPPPVNMTVNGVDLFFRRYIFELNATSAQFFLLLWDGRSPRERQEFNNPLAERLRAAMEGRRHHVLKKLEISLIGNLSPQEALDVLQLQLQQLIVTEKKSG